jgi:hypothetical protein
VTLRSVITVLSNFAGSTSTVVVSLVPIPSFMHLPRNGTLK